MATHGSTAPAREATPNPSKVALAPQAAAKAL